MLTIMFDFLCDLQPALKQVISRPITGIVRTIEQLEKIEPRAWHKPVFNCQQESPKPSSVEKKAVEEKLSPEAQAYKILKLDPQNIAEARRFNKAEVLAFNLIISLLQKDKLAGADGKFNKGDIEAIVASEKIPRFPKLLVRRELLMNADLLEGQNDATPRKLTIEELTTFKEATATMEEYTKRIKFEDKEKRFIPCSQSEWTDFISALMRCKAIPETVSRRPLAKMD